MIRELADALARGERVVLATVVRTERSVPRRPGSKMLVWADGRSTGSVGGGEMEQRVRTEAMAALADGRPRLVEYDLVDPSAGDPGVCGGHATIYLEPHMPPPTLLILGAGHVGAAVADLGHWLGHRVVVWDDRPDLLDGIEHADHTSSAPIADALGELELGPDAAVVVVTRNVDLDLELLPHLVVAGAGYVGVMGSARRWKTTRDALLERGVDEAALRTVHAPIGVEIEAETPEEIAVSILAEVIGSARGAGDGA